ncbi:uncharacterized protein LOC134842177 [Symsagittifera roscoffensis]|uniref:uncharacterized protein LOC134842177 n=1 Tax=Symsagittifera roscoffensis TaxID=84072 RepID=UPI00307C7006
MFQTVSYDFVRTVCGGGSNGIANLSTGEAILAAGSINEASKVKVGTFAIKTKREHFWQSNSCKLMLSNSVNLDPKSGTVENELLEGFSKEIDLSEKNTFNISALKQIGVNVLIGHDYKLSANLGPIHRLDMDKDFILDYSVPSSVACKLTKPHSRRVLGVVTSVFTVPNSATLTLTSELQIQDQISLMQLLKGGDESNIWKKDYLNSLKMVPGQVIAYCVEECTLDLSSNTFYFPSGGQRAEVKFVLGGGGSGDHSNQKTEEWIRGSAEFSSADTDSTYVMVPQTSQLEDETVQDLAESMSKLEERKQKQLSCLIRAAFKNSIEQELRSFVFEMVDNFDQLNPAISIRGFDCDNAQLLALMDFILRDGNYSVNILYYVYFLFQYAQELPVCVLIDVSDLKKEYFDMTKSIFSDVAEKCSNLHQNEVILSSKVYEVAKCVWNVLFDLQVNKPDGDKNGPEDSDNKNYVIKECKLSSAQYHVFSKFIELVLIF